MTVLPFTLPATLGEMLSVTLPFAPGAARQVLRADDRFLALIGDDPALVTTRELPDPLVRPCVTIQAGVNRRENIMLSKARLIISAWVPKIEILVDGDPPTRVDPEELAWNIAALAGSILDTPRIMGRGETFTYRGHEWRSQWDEGPITMVDLERGHDNPLYRAVIQVVMKMGS